MPRRRLRFEMTQFEQNEQQLGRVLAQKEATEKVRSKKFGRCDRATALMFREAFKSEL